MLRGIIKNGITIIIITIIAILLIAQLNISSAATLGQTVNFGGKDISNKELKLEGNKIYCVQKGRHFNRYGSGIINEIVDINAGSSEQDLATAYVLTKPDTALDSSAIDSRDLDYLVNVKGWSHEGAEVWTMQGVYNITSKNQNAIWAIKNGNGMSGTEENFVSNTAWDSDEGESVTYNWDTDGNGSTEAHKVRKDGYYFKFDNSDVQYTQIYDSGYYSEGLNLYQEAVNFAKRYDTRYIENTTVGTPVQDYSDPNYILIGPYSVSVFSEITGVTFKDQNGSTINSSDIGIFTKSGSIITPINLSTWTGGNFYIGLKKSATSISEVKTVTFTSKKEVISGKLYYIDCGAANQNVVCGDVELKEESKDFPIDLNQQLIPPRIEKVTILKSELGGGILPGAKFNITLNNVQSIGGGYSTTAVDGKITLYATSNSNGEIVLEELEIADVNTDITIEIEETEVPDGYKKIDGKIKIVLERDGNKYKISSATTKDATVRDSEFKASDVTISADDEVTIKINNIPLIDVGGFVWEDAQIGNKLVEGADNKFTSYYKYTMVEDGKGDYIREKENNEYVYKEVGSGNGNFTREEITEELINGIEVFLIEGNPIFDANGNLTNTVIAQDVTEDGKYLFEKIEKKDNYYVVFKYDGIDYEAVAKGTENNASKVDETDRAKFNQNFQTITSASYGADGKLVSATTMYAVSDKINATNLNINCGLRDRFFDLAMGMDIEKAELKINGKTTTYNYNQILDGALSDIRLDKLLENTSSGSDTEYNLKLYESDYNYRIGDYKKDGITNNVTDANDSEIIDNNVTDITEELNVFVTYKVAIKNQSKIEDAKVNKLAYYYDTNYTFKSIVGQGSIAFTTLGTKTINGKEYNYAEISIDDEYNLGADDYRQELYLTFEVKKSEDGTRTLPKDVKCANIVEILSYTTAEGLVDNDSIPGNLETAGYEDDTDEALGINIKVRSEKRKISGTVFEDIDKNGSNNDDTLVNDVIVQLIEVKKISDKYYEYIWQETRSGRNEVKTTARNGYAGESYTNGVAENSGMFEFTDFIPGNYIIRYIYGDGTTYDITTEQYKNSAPNVQKYNGQDYQSTIDSYYKTSWYNTAGYVADQSVARDNEARRLEVMAYSTKIDKTIGKALEEKTALNETWMCAETSRINVPVDAVNKATEIDNTTVSFEHINNNVEFPNINFGLALRPQTKLVLEKHITGLKITPNGVGVQPIVEAKIDIKDILNEPDSTLQGKLQGVTSGLSIIKSDRNNRGFWKVETDIEELAQGATLEVEYTYVIKNESDEDYLNSALVYQYETNLENYSNYLNSLIPSLKDGIMRTGQYAYSNDNAIGGYLGEFYYTGVKGAGDIEVLSRVDNLKESLNEQFGKQEKVSDYFEARDPETGDVKAYLDREGNLASTPKDILTVLESNSTSKFLVGKSGDVYTEDDTDWSKTAKVTTVLASSSSKGIGGTYPSYIVEITGYSNAAGRRNMEGTPGNLEFVHSEDTTMTMDTHNELDEFWGESIIISKPTGEDKLTGVQIAIITTISVAILGVGIVLIKKFVLKK